MVGQLGGVGGMRNRKWKVRIVHFLAKRNNKKEDEGTS